MTPPRRGTPICDAVRATGSAHRLGSTPILLIVRGHTLRFCRLSCLLSYVCDQPYEDRPISAVG